MAYQYTVYTPTTAPGTKSLSPVADDFAGDDGTSGGWSGYGDYDNAFNDAHYDDGDDAPVAPASVVDDGNGVVTVVSAEAQASVKAEVLARWAAAPQAKRDAVAALGRRLTLGAPLTPDDFANLRLALHRMRPVSDSVIRQCTAAPMDDEAVVRCMCQNNSLRQAHRVPAAARRRAWVGRAPARRITSYLPATGRWSRPHTT